MHKAQAKKKSFIEYVTEYGVLLVVIFLIRTYLFGLYQVPTGSMETTMLVGERYFADKLSYNFRKPRHGEIIAFNDPLFVYSSSTMMSLFEQYVWGPQNWTKRIIGIPGDTIKGVIEDNKPVVYRNGQKLDEPYVNQYPIILVWKTDPEKFFDGIRSELQGLFSQDLDRASIERIIMQRFGDKSTMRSYDPTKPYDDQPFYRLNENWIIRNEYGDPQSILYPDKPVQPRRTSLSNNKTRHWDSSDQFYVELGPDEYWCLGDNRKGSRDCRFFGPVKEKYIHGRIVFRLFSIDSDESWWIIDLVRHPIDFWSRIRWSRFMQWVY
jgi:signal peptidase I